MARKPPETPIYLESSDDDIIMPPDDDLIMPSVEESTAGLALGKSETGVDGWKSGQAVPYASLASVFEKIELTVKRPEKQEIFGEFLLEVIRKSPGDLVSVLYLSLNQVRPVYEGPSIEISQTNLINSISDTLDCTTVNFKSEYAKLGDLGLTTVELQKRKRQGTLFAHLPLASTLAVEKVFSCFKKIATLKPKDHDRYVNQLIGGSRGVQTKYIVRSLEGSLGIGLNEKTVIASLARAAVAAEDAHDALPPLSPRIESRIAAVNEAFSACPNLELLVPELFKDGVDGLPGSCPPRPGVPFGPMLAAHALDVKSIVKRLQGQQYTSEYKYDGERAQVHISEGKVVAVAARNLKDISHKYPELSDLLPRCLNEGTRSAILDCEILALPPQINLDDSLSTAAAPSASKAKKMKRTGDKAARGGEGPSEAGHSVVALDIVYLNDVSLLHEEWSYRRQLLQGAFDPIEGEFMFATSDDSSTLEGIALTLEQSIQSGCEGIVVKLLKGDFSKYHPNTRSNYWYKIKPEYLQVGGDTLDLLVIGADYEAGQRITYAAVLLACYDRESGKYQAIGRLRLNFAIDDKAIDELKARVRTKSMSYDIGTTKGADVYFKPEIVWEVAATVFEQSSEYPAAKGLCGPSGISIGFPRFVRVRDDKDAKSCTTSASVAQSFESQHGHDNDD